MRTAHLCDCVRGGGIAGRADIGQIADRLHSHLRRAPRQIAEEDLVDIDDFDALRGAAGGRDPRLNGFTDARQRGVAWCFVVVDDLIDLRADLGDRRANGVGDGGVRGGGQSSPRP